MDHSWHDHSHGEHIEPVESVGEYLKFTGVIVGILGLSVVVAMAGGWNLMEFMTSFMAIFFVVFGAFKLVNLRIFALTYSSYDILAKRFKFWAWTFPFIELGLGVGYILIGNSIWLNVSVIFITAMGSIGVAKQLRQKSKFKCACLGSVIRLPLSKITFVENFAMFAMAAAMIALQ